MRLLEDSLAEEILSGRIKRRYSCSRCDDSGTVKVLAQERRELLPQAVVE